MSSQNPQDPAIDEAAASQPKKRVTKRVPREKITAHEENSQETAPPVAKEPVRATRRTTKPRLSDAPPTSSAPEPESISPQQTLESPRFGRLPGGGPVVRDNQDSPNRSQQNSRDFSQPRQVSKFREPSRNFSNDQGRQRGHTKHSQNGNRRSSFRQESKPRDIKQEPKPLVLTGEKIACDGLLEIQPKGGAYLRTKENRLMPQASDVFVSPELMLRYSLRPAHWIQGFYQQSARGPQLVEITQINNFTPQEAKKFPYFEELKAINPDKRISFETDPARHTTRILDLVSPVGRGQRGLIVSPPRSGKTTLLLHIAQAVEDNYSDNIHLMIVLIDERPEEVTEFRRTLPNAELYASSNDEQTRSHTRIAELAIERAKRLVESGKDVLILMDSITRLARAYNHAPQPRGRGIGSGGLNVGSLEVPRRLFAAARNTREAGSLTILATALVQTNSKADEAIFQEFKGTGNMELVLDRRIAELYLYPAVDIFKSGTRREELLLPEHMLDKIYRIRRGLSGHRPPEALERLLSVMKKFPSNPQLLLEIK